jgi:uncharacterized protein YkwD
MRLSVRHAAIVSVLCALLAGTGVGSRAQSLRAVDIQAEQQAAEAMIAERIDAERARLAPDAPPLASDPVLDQIARQRSADMAHGAPFAHEDATGRFIADDRVRARFGPYGSVGENIMFENAPSRLFDAESFARRAVQGWMNSPDHRANILSPTYDHAGVGVAIEGSRAYATQVFWGPPTRIPRPPAGAQSPLPP